MCFFRNKDNKLCKLLLGIPELIKHTGSSISGEIIAVLQSFGITPERVGYFTLDNAENNTTVMVAIGQKLGFDGKLRRGRCIGHIVNLAAKALLFENDPNAFEKQLDGTSPLNNADYQLWRTQGPIGRLHNLVIDVRNMHKLSHGFLKIQKKAGITNTLRLIINNETRWLSQLYMVRRAIQLKTYIKTLLIMVQKDWNKQNRSRSGIISKHKLNKLPRYLRAENQLNDRDWDVLQHLKSILTVFETVVKTLKGDGQPRIRRHKRIKSYGNMWNIILGFELLLSKLEEFKQLATEFPDFEQFRVNINLAWEKLDKYYNLLNETPIYYTALALYPAYRWNWFDEI
jgi:hypothetical protein